MAGTNDLALVYNGMMSWGNRGSRSHRSVVQMPPHLLIGSNLRAIGSGIAIVHFNIVRADRNLDNLGSEDESDKWPNLWNGDSIPFKIRAYTDSKLSFNAAELNSKQDTPYELHVKLWATGSINVDALTKQCAHHVSQAVHLYALKRFYLSSDLKSHYSPKFVFCSGTLNDFHRRQLNPLAQVIDSAVSLGCIGVSGSFRPRSSQLGIV